MSMYKIGIDLGGTKIEAIVTDENYKEIFRKRIPNGKEGGYENILNQINSLYQGLLTEINHAEHTLGLGTPGSIAKNTGLLKCSNITCMVGKPFEADLKALLGHPIVVENDANLFALAEATLGAGKDKEIVFGVIMGTGVGGGLVINGKVIRGLGENAGEWGHSTINYDNGPIWANGPKGIVESYLSGTGVQVLYKEIYGNELSMAEIVKRYRENDPKASSIMMEFFDHFGLSVSNLIKYVDPDIIIIGGGLSNIDEVYTVGIEHVRKYVFNNDLYTPIVKNQYGDSAGVFGAAIVGI